MAVKIISMWKFLIIGIVLGAGMLLWAFGIEPKLLMPRFYRLPQQNLAGLRIVFISDLHIAPNQRGRLQKIVREANKSEPDIIILGGDYVKGHKGTTSMPPEKIAAELRKLQAKNGIFAVLGNHDWYLDGEKVRQALQQAGIPVLENENISLQTGRGELTIAGAADYTMRIPDLEKTLKGAHAPVLLVTHSPDIFPQVPKNVMLTLAGHTHGGQVAVPFIGPLLIPSDFGRRYAGGLIEEDGKKMIVGRGLGTSLLPVRFNCPPEIVIIDFE